MRNHEIKDINIDFTGDCHMGNTSNCGNKWAKTHNLAQLHHPSPELFMHGNNICPSPIKGGH